MPLVGAVAELANLDNKSIQHFLKNELNVKKVCVVMVPKILSAEQKELKKEICSDLLQLLYPEP